MRTKSVHRKPLHVFANVSQSPKVNAGMAPAMRFDRNSPKNTYVLPADMRVTCHPRCPANGSRQTAAAHRPDDPHASTMQTMLAR